MSATAPQPPAAWTPGRPLKEPWQSLVCLGCGVLPILAAGVLMMSFSWGWWDGCHRRMNPPPPDRSDADVKMSAAKFGVNIWANHASGQVGRDGWFDREAVFAEPRWRQEGTDPWGRPYQIQYARSADRETLVVWSDGPDGVAGTADDLHGSMYTLRHADTVRRIAATRAQIEARLAGNAWGDAAACDYESHPKGVTRRVPAAEPKGAP